MIRTVEAYEAAFHRERAESYPVMDAIEAQYGYAIDRMKLESAARVLACPLKPNPPNWQHGRLLYALTRRYLATVQTPVCVVDVGTAKGFSALCLRWALDDAGKDGSIVSVDVLDPDARVKRNTVEEVEGFRTLAEILARWPESDRIQFLKGTGAEVIRWHSRVHVAYLDGKHTFEAVSAEVALLAERQEPGDLVIFDDAQIEGVQQAIAKAEAQYAITRIDLKPGRAYAIGVRRG